MKARVVKKMWFLRIIAFTKRAVLLALAAVQAFVSLGAASLAKPQRGLPYVAMGQLNAPYTLVMFFSPTCTHCAEYEQSELPKIYEKFIETGVVKFEAKILPVNGVDLAVGKLIWSQGAQYYFKNMLLFMQGQSTWLMPILEKDQTKRKAAFDVMLASLPPVVRPQEIINALDLTVQQPTDEDFVKLFALLNGLSVEEIIMALQNKKCEELLMAHRLEALDEDGQEVGYIPVFYFNGTMMQDVATADEVHKMLINVSAPSKAKAVKRKGLAPQPLGHTKPAETAALEDDS
jgi:hypothetical protein